MNRVNRWYAALVALAVVSVSTAAIAAPTAKERAEARTLAANGRKALRDKRWMDAVTALKKADRLDPGPAIEVDLAHAQIGAGRLVEARKTLAAAAAGAPGTLPARRAREAAKKAHDALQARVPTVKVQVTGAPAGKARLLVDGIEIDASAEIPVDPGDHTIGAEADGFVAAEREVKLAEGAHEEITLELAPVRPVVVEEKKAAGNRVPGAVATALGGAGLVVGGIFGGLAFSKTSAAKASCSGNVCPPATTNAIAASKTYGNVSTGAFVAGGALAVTGIVLLIVPPGRGARSDDAGRSAAVPRVSPWIGPGVAGLGATGSF